MFENNNFFLLLLSFIPALIYAFMIYLKSPKRTLKLRTSGIYILTGLLSINIWTILMFIFPNYQDYIDGTVQMVQRGPFVYTVFTPTVWAYFVFAFVQVGLLEEVCKWIAFQAGNYTRLLKYKNDSPYAVMFYSCLAAAAFSMYENMTYAQRTFIEGDPLYGADPENMLIIRAIGAVILHMLCGLMMGYFIALGRGKKWLRRVGNTIIGIVVATLLHGIYDFNYFVSVETDYIKIGATYFHVSNNIIMLLSLVMVYLMAMDLKRKTLISDIRLS